MSHKIKNFFSSNEEILYIIFLSLIFALTVQQFYIFKGNAAHLIHSIKEFDDNKLQNDWIANQEHHLPLFTYYNTFVIQSEEQIEQKKNLKNSSMGIKMALKNTRIAPKIE